MQAATSVKATLSVLGVLLGPLMVAPAQAQRTAGPRYDPATEVTVKGTIEEVREIPHGTWSAGIHLTLKTDQTAMDVHVGPARFLAAHAMTLAKGDQIGVTGSKVSYDGKDALLAREIKKGEQTLTLRDSKGIPEWSRGRRRSR
jgi:DNA/RNA endonuclease YhcR with UshA esterase domain